MEGCPGEATGLRSAHLRHAPDEHVAAFADLVRRPRLLASPAAGPSLLRSQALGRGSTTSAEGLVRPFLTDHAVACPAPLRVDEAWPTRRCVHATTRAGGTGAPRSSPRARHRRAAARHRRRSLWARVRPVPARPDSTSKRALDRGSRFVAGRHSLAVRACRAERRPLAAHARPPGRLVPHPARIRQADSEGRAQIKPAPRARLS